MKRIEAGEMEKCESCEVFFKQTPRLAKNGRCFKCAKTSLCDSCVKPCGSCGKWVCESEECMHLACLEGCDKFFECGCGVRPREMYCCHCGDRYCSKCAVKCPVGRARLWILDMWVLCGDSRREF
eukprot:TRINITY_DN2601_c0_g1_i2.p1 TRINITY_DN2601_c0_g1~~TRINITY_DN2601_c0_g1_i2.p1  ORF type:complete len:125 (+),score=3.95 TRINITY_DN2601_c0_g1_i2:249-623(+)